MARQNPLRAVFQIQRNELPLALLMFSYFFLVFLRTDARRLRTSAETLIPARLAAFPKARNSASVSRTST